MPEWLLAQTEDALCIISTEVADLEPLSGEIIIYLKLASGQTVVALWPEPETLPSVGETLRVGINQQSFLLFDAATELALKADCEEKTHSLKGPRSR